MDEIQLFWRFSVALGLGMIVGLQREHSAAGENGPGVRTFAITSLLGAALAYLASQWQSGAWPIAAGLLALASFVAVNLYIKSGSGLHGTTTGISLLLVYVVGALCLSELLIVPTSIAVALTVLLTFKVELHRFAHSLTHADVVAVIKFLVISAIILPLLPDREFGPSGLSLFNPFKIWLLVVFISAISFVGYALVKWVGPDRGISITGLLGGLASSTALTLSFTQRSRITPHLSSMLATGIVVAWTVMYVRVLGIIWLLSPELGWVTAMPWLIPVIPGLLWCLWLWHKERGASMQQDQLPNLANPFELAPAFKFVFILTLVLAISRVAHMQFGQRGLFLSAFFAGLADVDAIALSVAQMSQREGAAFLSQGASAIVLAGIANTLTKGSIALWMGDRAMRRAIGPAMAFMVMSGGIALWWI